MILQNKSVTGKVDIATHNRVNKDLEYDMNTLS